MLFNHEMQLRAAHELAQSLLPADNSDLPTTEELCGILRNDGEVGVQRVVDVQQETLLLEWARANGLSIEQLAELCARLRGEAAVRVEE